MKRSLRARRRGATYTLIILALGTLLMAAGATLTAASRTVATFNASEARRVVTREALFAGVRWAEASVRERAHRGEGKLRLASGPVEVHYAVRERDGALLVTAAAPKAEPPTRLEATLTPDGAGFRLTAFTLHRAE